MILICRGCEKDFPEEEYPLRSDVKKKDVRRPYCKVCARDIARARYASHKRNSYFKLRASRARSRSQSLKVPFDLDAKYLESIWTDTCPVLGVTLARHHEKNDGCSAELDRFDKDKGYVRGNVTFISRRANRVKQDFGIEEVRAMLKWMEERE